LATEKKIKAVEEYKENLSDSKAIFITDYIGLTVEQINLIRRKIDSVGAKYKVVKNTLFKIASQGTDFEKVTEDMVGTNGVIFIKEDVVACAKALSELLKEFDKFHYKKGIFEGQIIDEEQLKALSTLPSKEVLQAKLLSLFVAPATNFVNLMAATPRNFLNLLNAYKEKKEV
jgi:large subunit ribosomal protein L10